jgi:hypothetical protein
MIQPLPLGSKRELGFRIALPEQQALMDLILQTILALHIGHHPPGCGKAILTGLITAHLQLDSSWEKIVRDPQEQINLMQRAFCAAYQLYQAHDDKEQAESYFQWPKHLPHDEKHVYHGEVLIRIGGELGHLMGREHLVLAQLQAAREAKKGGNEPCPAHISG